MILQSLLAYYEALEEKGCLPKVGWTKQKVSYALEIDESGKLLAYYPLMTEMQKGKKTYMAPREMETPAPFGRSSGICANFLCDNAKYMLGVDKDKTPGKPDRGSACFNAAKARYEEILAGVESPAAKAVLGYYRTFDIASAKENPVLAGVPEDFWNTANLIFVFKGEFVHNDSVIVKAWNNFYSNFDSKNANDSLMRCLITGDLTVPQATHPLITGFPGAQSSGAALVTFNAPAFCSYDREQNLNAPVGKYGAFAYTSALKYLISDKDHNKKYGDTLLLYWAEDAETAYQEAFGELLDPDTVTDNDLNDLMKKATRGQTFDWNTVPLDPSNHFYILGISPNAARLSVRFFYQDTFGSIISNLKAHYDRLKVVNDQYKLPQALPLWRLLKETVNPNSTDKSASPQLAGDMLRAILTGSRYPALLYQQLQIRIRADREINHPRAAIIKAYLEKNTNTEINKEVLTMELNESTNYQPYVLGRLFAVLERIQERASGVTTIKDKYFSSAASTPSVVFPRIVDLAEKHLRKMDGVEKVYYEKMLRSLLCMIDNTYPTHYTLAEQGAFQLGYYHQKQKFFEKKASEETDKN